MKERSGTGASLLGEGNKVGGGGHGRLGYARTRLKSMGHPLGTIGQAIKIN